MLLDNIEDHEGHKVVGEDSISGFLLGVLKLFL